MAFIAFAIQVLEEWGKSGLILSSTKIESHIFYRIPPVSKRVSPSYMGTEVHLAGYISSQFWFQCLTAFYHWYNQEGSCRCNLNKNKQHGTKHFCHYFMTSDTVIEIGLWTHLSRSSKLAATHITTTARSFTQQWTTGNFPVIKINDMS